VAVRICGSTINKRSEAICPLASMRLFTVSARSTASCRRSFSEKMNCVSSSFSISSGGRRLIRPSASLGLEKSASS